MKLVFAGTPPFARAALERLHAAGHELPLVLTQPDRPAGRGMKLQASAVKGFALEHGLPVAQPLGLRLDGKHPQAAAAARAALEAARPDVMVVAAYGLILPPWVLELPRLGCLNIHASLLPRWRGAAPIQRAIEAGDRETGICIMQMDAGLDTGDVLLAGHEPIHADDTSASLHDRLAALGSQLIVQALDQVAHGAAVAQRQPEEGVTYARKIDKSEAAIDWHQDADVIERRVRAFDPFPGATLQHGSETVKLWRAQVTPHAGAPGQVLALEPAGPVVACGRQALQLLELQRPGGSRVSGREFLAAARWRTGDGLTRV